jgi:hypothetical protein
MQGSGHEAGNETTFAVKQQIINKQVYAVVDR